MNMNCKDCDDIMCGGQGTDYENPNCNGWKYKAPPIGIKPKFIWIEERKTALLEAMNRYIQADMKIPTEWVKEYNSFVGMNTNGDVKNV